MEIQAPDEFPFPFDAYAIQKDFMRNIYDAIEMKKIGIFESPTGTGKSMSMICGSLTWLRDHESRVRKMVDEKLSSSKGSEVEKSSVVMSEEPDWIVEFIQKQEMKSEETEAKKLSDKLKTRDSKMKRILEGFEKDTSAEPSTKRMKFARHRTSKHGDDAEMLLEQAKRDLECHDRNVQGVATESEENDPNLILDEYYSDEDDDNKQTKSSINAENSDDDDDCLQKIFYCSRTHSQLTQFIREVQKSPFNQKNLDGEPNFYATVVPLASRQSLCINESVRKLGSIQQMNDKCLDMQKNSSKNNEDGDKENHDKKKTSACPYKTLKLVDNLSENILGKVQDIEEIVKSGKELTACPYYAARQALPMAQLIVLPYQTLLHSSTRKASGIKLKDSIIIVDEAHNLVDTISNIHSVEVTCAQVLRAHNQLSQYSKKFIKRLKAKNLMYVKQVLFVLKKLLSVMGASDAQISPEETKDNKNSTNLNEEEEMKTHLWTIHEFLFKSNLDNINLFKILRYCEKSMISRKLNGFVEKYESTGNFMKSEISSLSKFLSNVRKPQETKQEPEAKDSAVIMRSPLMHIENFLLSLTSSNEDGRIAITTLKDSSNSKPNQVWLREKASIKFLLLNPATHFREIVEECRSLIVAGGTMQPVSSFVNQLLKPLGVPTSRIHEFSCGHVIDKDQLLPIVVGSGPAGVNFEFTFEKRRSFKLIDELGRTLCNLCNIVPGGIVCFFPSYDYEKMVYSRWLETDIMKKIGLKKKVFREPKKSSQVDHILNEYSTCIRRTKTGNNVITGSLLLSVVGGKMSEGINFSDELGRCIVMVGLPYPNMYSAELKEKMTYLDANLPKIGTKSAGQSYYESLCMKAVNQSIGRAIRHRNDYACIVLADQRYARPNVISQLPGWISDKLQVSERFGIAFGSVRKFFMSKKTQQENSAL